MKFVGQYTAAALVIAALVAPGCGQSSSGGGGATAVDDRTPQALTASFLEAVRTGDDKTAANLLTPTARQKTTENEMVVAPPGSDTARYEIRDIQMTDGGANVASDWSDVGPDGHMHTDRIVWILRKEAEGWRIAGMASKVFPDRPPVILNFEDPEDMMRQQQMAEEEIARRDAKQAPAAAKQPASSVR